MGVLLLNDVTNVVCVTCTNSFNISGGTQDFYNARHISHLKCHLYFSTVFITRLPMAMDPMKLDVLPCNHRLSVVSALGMPITFHRQYQGNSMVKLLAQCRALLHTVK